MYSKIITVVIAVFAISVATAQFNDGLRDENRRMRRGAISGQLTRPELFRLKAEQNALRAQAFRFKANDGRIDGCERRMLKRGERRLNRHIFMQKHDRQRRII